jgi:hypothetical protein
VKEGFIFWEQEFRVTGPGTPATASARLSSLLSAARFSSGTRLAGTVDGSGFRVWRKSALTTEVVECKGVILPHGDGSVIEGKLQYKLATKIQFAGGLLLGVLLAVAGALQKLADPQPQSALATEGFLILAVILIWIYTSRRMTNEQIRFLTEKLEEIVVA